MARKSVVTTLVHRAGFDFGYANRLLADVRRGLERVEVHLWLLIAT